MGYAVIISFVSESITINAGQRPKFGANIEVISLLVDDIPAKARTKGPRYTPLSKRGDKPAAIAWIIRHHPELSDLQIGRLVGTTKPTIQAIRDRTHWNIKDIQPNDPVQLGLCKQYELDEVVQTAAERAAKKAAKEAKAAPVAPEAETPAE